MTETLVSLCCRSRRCGWTKLARNADSADKLVQDHWSEPGNEAHIVDAAPDPWRRAEDAE